MSLHVHRWEAVDEGSYTSDWQCSRCRKVWTFKWGSEPGLLGL